VPQLSALFSEAPRWRNFFENALTVQFDHRTVAYLIFFGVLAHAIDAARSSADGRVRAGAFALAGAVLLQVALGIATLLLRVPLPLALLHQGAAMLVLTAATLHAANVTARTRRFAARPQATSTKPSSAVALVDSGLAAPRRSGTTG
jgi:heme a synthase